MPHERRRASDVFLVLLLHPKGRRETQGYHAYPEKTSNWIKAHVQMFDFFGGVTPMPVSDNCSTAVNYEKSGWYITSLNTTYHEMAEHYNLAIIPARIRKPKDKPNVEGSVGKISTWITAALRNEQFFSLAELNDSIWELLDAYNARTTPCLISISKIRSVCV